MKDGSHSIINISVSSCLNALLTVTLSRRETCRTTRGMDTRRISFILSHREVIAARLYDADDDIMTAPRRSQISILCIHDR